MNSYNNSISTYRIEYSDDTQDYDVYFGDEYLSSFGDKTTAQEFIDECKEDVTRGESY